MQRHWLRAFSTASQENVKRRQLYPPLRGQLVRGPQPKYRFPRLRIWLLGEPSLLPDPEALSQLQSMGKAAFYAVQKGHKPGIYTTWSECEAQVKGFQGAAFKKFSTHKLAQDFVTGSSKPYANTTTKDTKSDAPPSRPASSKYLPENLATIVHDGFTITQTKPHHLVVYTDGSSRGNGKTGARAGLGVWWGDKRPASKLNLAERLPGVAQTNNRGELLAIIRALEVCPYPDMPLEIRTDSKYSISCMTIYLPKWIRNGFKTAGPDSTGIKNKDLILHLLSLLHDRGPGNGVKFKHVAAHCGEVGNEGADRLANQGAMGPEVPERLDWRTPGNEKKSAADEMATSPVDVEIEVDESWMMSPDEMAALEAEL